MFNLKLDYKEFAFKVAEAILINTDSHLLLIPHTYAPPGDPESDNHACEMVFRLLEKKYAGQVFKLSGSYNQFEIKSIIKDCCFFIGSRMHACIAGLSQGIPTAGVAYSRKFIGVFETVGAGNCIIDARTAELPNAVDNVIRLYMMRDEISTRIKSKADDLLRDLRCIFDGLVSADGCQG
jgi:polysaccharide pyruvyl transferase WcaK-like protein